MSAISCRVVAFDTSYMRLPYVDRYILLQAREEAAVGATAGLEEGVLRCRRQLHVISC